MTARQQQIAEFREALNKRHGLSEHALLIGRAIAGQDEPVGLARIWELIAVPPYPDDLAAINVVDTVHELRNRGCIRRVGDSGTWLWVAPWQP